MDTSRLCNFFWVPFMFYHGRPIGVPRDGRGGGRVWCERWVSGTNGNPWRKGESRGELLHKFILFFNLTSFYYTEQILPFFSKTSPKDKTCFLLRDKPHQSNNNKSDKQVIQLSPVRGYPRHRSPTKFPWEERSTLDLSRVEYRPCIIHKLFVACLST